MSMHLSPPRQVLTLASLAAALLLGACATTAPDAGPPPAAAPLEREAAAPPPKTADTAQQGFRQAESESMALLEDSLNPGAKIDLNDAAAQADLWARIRRGFAMPELDNEGVRRAEAWYSARPDYVQRMTERGSRYLFHIVEEVEKRGMPTELALLPFVESAFVTDATSRVKASGMWQFMPATGRDFALKQNVFRDDRRDVLASTRAALDYLGRLGKMFDGDWQLALAAYNWGQGNVSKAIARNQKAGLPTDYDSIKMPDETRYYLPKLQAVKNIVLRPDAYALSLPPVANHPYFLSVKIERDMDVALAASLAGMSEEHFRQFNPQMNQPVILAKAGGEAGGQVLLPYDNAAVFIGQLAAHQAVNRGPLASWTAWVVPKTMKPAEAAKQLGMSEAQLRELNKIPARMLVKQGSTLLVPRTAHRDQDVSEHLADNASMSLAPDVPPLRRVALKAGKGETVASVAKRWRVSAGQVAQWNKVGVKASFKPGQPLVIYTAQAEPAPTRVAQAGKPAPRPASKPAARVGGRTVTAMNNSAPVLSRQLTQRR